MSIIGVKSTFGEDLRRFSLPSYKFSDLEKNLRSVYSFGENQHLIIKYKDDEGDLVTISSDSELDIAFQLAQSSTLKITVNLSETSRNHAGETTTTISVPKEVEMTQPVTTSPSGSPYRNKYEKKIGKKMGSLEKKAEKLQNKAMKHGSARFVSENIPDGYFVVPGQEFVKTWRIRNESLNQWPSSYSFVFMKGENMSDVCSLHLPKTIEVGEEFEISIPIKVPHSLGKHVSVYRLIGLNDKPFGQPFRVKIIATDPKSMIPQEEMEKLLVDLSKMGFNERILNEKLIRKFGADMDKIVWKLSKKQQKKERKFDKSGEKKIRKQHKYSRE